MWKVHDNYNDGQRTKLTSAFGSGVLKFNFHYSTFIDKKIDQSVKKKKLKQIFNTTECYIRKNVYMFKIKSKYEKRISEFYYN